MKAFAIKFNDGYYWCGYNNSDKQLRKAVLYKSIKVAEETAKDCMNRTEYIRPYGNKIVSYEIVEITIVEGNFDAYIDTLQDERDFERRDKTLIIKQLNDSNDYVIREDYIKLETENKQLKEQLAIRDKMIEIASENFIYYENEKEHKKELKRQFSFWEKLAKESLK